MAKRTLHVTYLSTPENIMGDTEDFPNFESYETENGSLIIQFNTIFEEPGRSWRRVHKVIPLSEIQQIVEKYVEDEVDIEDRERELEDVKKMKQAMLSMNQPGTVTSSIGTATLGSYPSLGGVSGATNAAAPTTFTGFDTFPMNGGL